MTPEKRAEQLINEHLGRSVFIVGKGLLDFREALAAAFRAAIAEEREACAQIVEQNAEARGAFSLVGRDLAAAIWART